MFSSVTWPTKLTHNHAPSATRRHGAVIRNITEAMKGIIGVFTLHPRVGAAGEWLFLAINDRPVIKLNEPPSALGYATKWFYILNPSTRGGALPMHGQWQNNGTWCWSSLNFVVHFAWMLCIFSISLQGCKWVFSSRLTNPLAQSFLRC
jgi:hypothetical protein